jgi:hypothetical protein
MTTNFTQKNSKYFECNICDFKCCNKNDFNRHILTRKHEILQNTTKKTQKNSSIFNCDCGKEYKHHSSLWNHKKKCILEKVRKQEEENDTVPDKKLMLTLMTQNTELQKQMIDLMKSGTTNINNNNNSHNKTFNLQLFLNETCKDAMDIMDFVDSIKFQLSDLESVGELGYINGLSKIIIKNLKALDENMRPVHCSDLKREKIYIKDAGKWEKESADNKILKNAIKYVAHKNVKMIPAFREKYPDCIYSESRKSDQYNRLIIEAMGGDGNDEDGKANKIISKIAKEVLIEK